LTDELQYFFLKEEKMIRIVLLVILIGVIVGIIRMFTNSKKLRSNTCKSCDGEGYWEGTRGDRNFCKNCGGRGYLGK
jgi:DnaJ-class molecular chaperone